MSELKPYERKLLVVLLKLASEQFSNRSCNDFNLKQGYGVELTEEEIRQLNEDYYRWNGDLEEMSEESLNSEYAMDWALMDFLANRIEKGES